MRMRARREGGREGGRTYQRLAVCLSETGEHEADASNVVVGGADEGEEALDRVLPGEGGREGGREGGMA